MIRIACLMLALTGDPGGWQGARWGMTETEVLAAVPGVSRDVGIERKAGLALKVEIAGMAWQAFFYFESGLERVVLAPTREEDRTDDDLCRVERLLVQKYGRPWRNSGAETRVSQWTLGGTVITLELVRHRAIGLRFLHLVYERRRAVAGL